MNSIKTETLEKESYYQFLCDFFQSKDFTVFSLAGDASARKYYRIVHNNTSYVLMEWEPFTDDSNYPFLSVLNHFHNNGIHVPNVLAKSPQLGYILLEDLGDLTLERRFWETSNQEDVLPYYKLAIDELIKIHLTATDNKGACTAFDIAFDIEKLTWEMNYAKKHYLCDFLENSLSSSEDEILKKSFHQIASILHNEKKVICHRDYHSRNVMFKLGKIFVIDFQDARLGPIQYDLVSLLKDSYVKLSDSLQEKLLDYYFQSWEKQTGRALDQQAFFEIYPYQVVQRCFKACGSFASFYNTREDKRYLKYLKPTSEIVFEYLNQLPNEFSDFKNLYEAKILNNKKYLAL